MIKIRLTVEQMNKINKFGKKYNDVKSKERPNLKYSRFTIKGNKLTIEGLDGYKLFELNMEIENLSDVDGQLYIEPMKNFKKSDEYVFITESENEIRIETNSDKRIVENKNGDFFIDTSKLMKDDKPTFKIVFDAKKLKEALEAYDKDIVSLEFFGELEQVQISNRLDSKSMLLPIRLGDKS